MTESNPSTPHRRIIARQLIAVGFLATATVGAGVAYNHHEYKQLESRACADIGQTDSKRFDIISTPPVLAYQNGTGDTGHTLEFTQSGASTLGKPYTIHMASKARVDRHGYFGEANRGMYEFTCSEDITNRLGSKADVVFTQPVCDDDDDHLHATAHYAYAGKFQRLGIDLETGCDPKIAVAKIGELTLNQYDYQVGR